MKKIKIIILVVVISFALLLTVNDDRNAEIEFETEFDNENNLNTPNSAEIHVPIYIEGNEELAVFIGNEGLEGNGSYLSPYIIEGFDINSSSENGIEIRHTDKYMIIRNCTIEAEAYEYFGILMINCSNVNLTNNIITKNHIGIALTISKNNILMNNNVSGNNITGILMNYSNSTRLFENNISSNKGFGILTGDSENNTFSMNDISNNYNAGINLDSCNNNTFSMNIINNTHYEGIYLEYGDNNTFLDNNINYNNVGIFIRWANNNSFLRNNASCNRGYGIFIENSNNNFLTANKANNNNQGIGLQTSNDNTLVMNLARENDNSGVQMSASDSNIIFHNEINYNYYGIDMGYSDDNIVYGNEVIFNNHTGIDLHGCNYNSFYQNDIHENVIDQANENENCGNNQWDNDIIGNYWGSDYSARYPNATNDGVFWDTPYEINGTGGGIDNHSLAISVFNPLIVITPDDFSAKENYTDLSIFWTVYNLIPAIYTIELNGIEIVSTTEWVSGEDIHYNIPEGLLEGEHNVTITISDESGNIAQDTVIFTVITDEILSSVAGFSTLFIELISIIAIIGIVFSIKKRRIS